MSVKKLEDGRYEVDVRPRGATESASVGSLNAKLRHMLLSAASLRSTRIMNT